MLSLNEDKDKEIEFLKEEIGFLKEDISKLEAELEAEQKKHRWIPVEDRLPEDDEVVLVTVVEQFGPVTMGRRTEFAIYSEDADWRVKGCSFMDHVKVTAWMPSLDAYRGDGK